MYGHLESPRHVVNHLNLLRSIQKRTHGFTEFVPLRFIHENTVLFRKGLVKPPEIGVLDFQMYAFSRLFLRGLNRQSPDFMGETRRRSRSDHAQGRVQRFLRHPDGGEHHGAGGWNLPASSCRST